MKCLIVLKGHSDTGKSTILKKLGEILINQYNFQCWEIGACEKNQNEFLKQKVDYSNLPLNKDIFLEGEINNKKIIISSGGDYLRCIDRFLERFVKDEISAGIVACQYNSPNKNKCKNILKITDIGDVSLMMFSTIDKKEKIDEFHDAKAKELLYLLEDITNE